MEKEVIRAAKAGRAKGPFVQAIKVGNILYMSGCRGIDPKTNQVWKDDIRAEARQVMENMKGVVVDRLSTSCMRSISVKRCRRGLLWKYPASMRIATSK
jgi:enamine deaminase RidA (YjgF/YER057c/UK114 family)